MLRRIVPAALAVLTLSLAGLVYVLSDHWTALPDRVGGRGIIAEAPAGGPFTLTDHTGRVVTEETFKGRYLLLSFGFTHCPDVCPLTLDRFVRVMESLGDEADKVQPVLVTVDPERDTPEVLADYVAAFDPRILGLTGTPEQIKAMTNAYLAYAKKGEMAPDGSYVVDHSSFAYLMGPDGANAFMFTTDATPERMAEAISDDITALQKVGVRFLDEK